MLMRVTSNIDSMVKNQLQLKNLIKSQFFVTVSKKVEL